MPKYGDASVYLLEDINDIQYIGSTAQRDLYERLSTHRRDKKIGAGCSSANLNLSYCSMTFLEMCVNTKEVRKKREGHYIKQYPNCVNEYRLDGGLHTGTMKWEDYTPEQKKNKMAANKKWRLKNKDKVNAQRRINYLHKKLENL